MEYIFIGNIVNTHGIKGEVRIISDFEYKKHVFKQGFKLYVGVNKEELIINTHRFHKIFDMVTFEGFNNINEVLKYKGEKVYAKRADIDVSGYFKSDLIGMEVYTDHLVGQVKEIIKSKAHDILVVTNLGKRYMIPLIEEFILNVNLEERKIYIQEIEGLIDEN